MCLFENIRCTTDDIFVKCSLSDVSRLRMTTVPGLYFSAAEKRWSWTICSVVLASGNALSNSNDSWTESIASWRRTWITTCCEVRFTFFLKVKTNSVSEGHVLHVPATLVLVSTLQCWWDMSFPTVPPVRILTGAGPVVLSGLFHVGLYRNIMS